MLRDNSVWTASMISNMARYITNEQYDNCMTAATLELYYYKTVCATANENN